jgi:hypothetical protein
MADESQVLRGINWREAFPFAHIFRAFRIAIHPSKLVLALLAVLSLYLGGRVMDYAWRVLAPQYRAVPGEYREVSGEPGAPGEVLLFEQAATDQDFVAARDAARKSIQARYATELQQLAELKSHKGKPWTGYQNREEALRAAEQAKGSGDVRYWIGQRRQQEAAEARREYEAVADRDPGPTEGALEAAAKRRDESIRAAYAGAATRLRTVRQVEGQGPFVAFFEYETLQIRNIVQGVLGGNWLGGLPGSGMGQGGVVTSVVKFFTVAPWWAMRHHPVYFILFGAMFLVMWSLFGGAIARIAAVQVADEGRKLSMRQGLSFALSKFLSFLSAPLIPLIIVAGIGAVLMAGSGLLFVLRLDVVVGLLYILALAAGFVMTLVLLGMAGGFNLMYSTIAVEGSDSFDAISRSFSYVYAKPWRMLFYSGVALAYGALTFLFVRLFIWLVLALTNFFVGALAYREAANLNDLWTTIQPPPDFMHLPYQIHWESLGWYGDLTAWLVALWTYLVIAMLGAFAISFYFSANTIIYYLMRREVDATEMDDVYLEQPEEEFGEAAGAPAGETAGVSAAGETAPSAGGGGGGPRGAAVGWAPPAAPPGV